MLEAYKQAIINLKTTNKPQILPPYIIKKIKERRKLRREYIKTRNPYLKTEINQIKKQIDEDIAKIKRDSWNDLFEKSKKQLISTKIK
jgi:hypothetical protein